jgi:hypothetical protein
MNAFTPRMRILAALAVLVFSSASVSAASHNGLVIITEFGQYETIKQTLSQERHELPRPYGIGAASNLFLNALYQDVPVLAPGPLVGNIAEHKRIFDNFTTIKSIDKLYKLYRNYARFKTAASIEHFMRLCTFGKTTYASIIQCLNGGCDSTTLKDKITHDPIFKVPASLANVQENSWLELSLYLQCHAAPVDRYKIFTIYPDGHPEMPWYLFIPKNYFTSKDVQKNAGETFSELEKSFGFALKHLIPVDDPFTIHQEVTHSADYAKHFISLLRKLFITRQHCASHALPAWTLYVMGHGINCESSKNRLLKEKKNLATMHDPVCIDECKKHIENLECANKICCLPSSLFTAFLTFLEEELTTNLLFYSSCSAGGKQAVDSLSRNGKPLKLTYPLIADALQEARSINVTPIFLLNLLNPTTLVDDISSMIDWKKRQLILKTPYDFYSFFALAGNASQKTPEGVSHLISTLCPVFRCNDPFKKQSKGVPLSKDTRLSSSLKAFIKRSTDSLDRQDIINIPTIRLPQRTHFNIIDGANTYLELSHECGQKNDSLHVSSNKEALMVSTPTISCPITLSGDGLPPYFISMIPGNAFHEINHIHAQSANISEILANFFVCDGISVSKGYHIKKLTCFDNLFTHKVKTFENVFIFLSVMHKDRSKNGIAFEHHGELLGTLWSNEEPLPGNIKKRLSHLSDNTLDGLLDQFVDANKLSKEMVDNPLIISPATVSQALSDSALKV